MKKISRKENEEIIYQSVAQLGGQEEGGGGYPMPLSLEIMASFHHASRKWPNSSSSPSILSFSSMTWQREK